MNNRFQFFSCIMFVVFLNILIIHSGTSRAQTSIDSLKMVIADQVDDSAKVMNYLTLAQELRKSDRQQAIKYCKIAYDLASQMNYYPGQKKSLYKLSYIYRSIEKYDSALLYNQKHKVLILSRNDSLSIAANFYQHGSLMRDLQKNTLANADYTESLKLYQVLKDTSGLIRVYNCIGIVHKNLTNFDSAAYYYRKAMDLCRLSGMDNNIGPTLINLGKVYLELSDYTNAKKYLKESIELYKKLNSVDKLALAYNILGMTTYEEQKFEEALSYYKKAMSIYKERGKSSVGIYNIHNNIGNIYKERKDYEKALSNYNIAILGFQEIDPTNPGLISALMNKASVYSIHKRFDEAIVLLDSALALAVKTDDREKRRETYNIIYLTYKRAGQYQKAITFLEKYHFLNDSIYKLEKEEIIAELILVYEKEKDKAKLAELENETLVKTNQLEKRTNQRNRYLFGGSAIILFFIFFFTYYQQRTRKNRIIAEQRINQLEEEKKFLAARCW